MRRGTVLVCILMAACATTGSNGGNMAIETTAAGRPLEGSHCTVTGGTHTWSVTTPATINVGSATGDLRVVCNHAGYRTSETLMRPARPIYPGVGVGLGGGNVGVGVGLNVPVMLTRSGYATRAVVEMAPD